MMLVLVRDFTGLRFMLAVGLLSVCFSAAAEKFNGFDVSNSLIPRKHIVQGGPPRDGIPAIFDPHYVDANQATFLRSDDFVLGVEIAGRALAFPRHILNWHELVNDEVAGHPFLISYCPLCGTGMAFSSKLGSQTLGFGVSGLLYNSDLLFYDRQTESLWSQLERRAISGPYAGTELTQLPMSHTTWARWLEDNPQTKVLSENQGVKRNYRHDPYSGYETSSRLFFKTLREAPKDYHTKERVLGLVLGDLARAYPYVELRKYGKASFVDQFAGEEYRVLWDAESDTAKIESLAGEPIVTTIAYWFAWYAFHPQTEVFRAAP